MCREALYESRRRPDRRRSFAEGVRRHRAPEGGSIPPKRGSADTVKTCFTDGRGGPLFSCL